MLPVKEISKHLNAASANIFSSLYPDLNNYIYGLNESQNSRYGLTKEVTDFKTHLTNPYYRCTGGFGRDTNIFFLLAEALWILVGRQDVKFLKFFNNRMSEFSDDGINFHAPYGFRLRNYGIASSKDDFIHSFDQVKAAIRMFENNHDDRRVVMSIWNPNLDLETTSKDIPCNDMVMLKIRNNKLVTTIANRSNDLHWGLTTNVFQFSFITECMAAALGIELGTQTHNSQSLHVYTENPIASQLWFEYNNRKESYKDLYDLAEMRKMDFNFNMDTAVMKFNQIDTAAHIIIDSLELLMKGEKPDSKDLMWLGGFSKYFTTIYSILSLYVEYKLKLTSLKDDESKNLLKMEMIDRISQISGEKKNLDIIVLAKNFMAKRIGGKSQLLKPIGTF